jgi:hypothetical protein
MNWLFECAASALELASAAIRTSLPMVVRLG